MNAKTSVILLAGGTGSRMQTELPKQFLLLGDKSVVRHSFDLFLEMPEIDEIVVVCAPIYQTIFKNNNPDKTIRFALPGNRRQDSVYNGFLASNPTNEFICVHDGARPLIDTSLVKRVLNAGKKYGASTVGMPVKFTVKESDSEGFVKHTPDRNHLWEIQTPQVLQRDIMKKGFEYAIAHHITVTDDVSLAELIGHQVKLTEGSHTNLKITIPADMTVATHLIQQMTPT